jgi:hypothetical protein
MATLSKFNLKTVKRNSGNDPKINKRNKLLKALEHQLVAVQHRINGTEYKATKKVWVDTGSGSTELKEVPKRIRPWYFEQDSGWYVQCRYGARVLDIVARSNSIYVNKVDDIPKVLKALIEATNKGELDDAIEKVSMRRTLAV